jgi:hypothetical protein
VRDNGHAVFVGSREEAAEAIDVRRIVVIDPGVCEVQLQAAPQVRILRTTGQLVKRV